MLGSLASLFVLGMAIFGIAYVTTPIPDVNEVAKAQTTIVYWNDGKSELARLGDTNRISVPLSDVPVDTQHAVVAAEDRNFYEHSGFDVKGMLRAFWNNLTSDSTQGGSTITQQLAKNLFLTDEQSYLRKFQELVLATKLEVQLSKDEILEMYLNTIFYGRGAYGIQTGAEAYFKTDAKVLTLEQGAVLASVINGPGTYNPDDPEGLKRLEDRYAYVLDGMVQEGWLTDEARTEALGQFPEIAKRSTSERYGGPQGFLLRSVQDELLSKGFTQEQIEAGGLRVITTFSEQSQEAAEDAVAEQAPTSGMEGVRIGLAAVEPVTGEIVAMYGGADYLQDSFNNATQARYQAGSTFKPFGLVAATEDGIGLNSLWPGNSGTVVQGYTVNNYANNSYGSQVTLLRGTEQSINTVYVSVEAETGVPAVRTAAEAAGIPADTPGLDNTDLTFVLGHRVTAHRRHRQLVRDVCRAWPTLGWRDDDPPGRDLRGQRALPAHQQVDERHRRQHRGRRELSPAERRAERHRHPCARAGPASGREDRIDRRLQVGLVRRLHTAAGRGGQLRQVGRGRLRGFAVRGGRADRVLRQRLPGPDLDRLHAGRPGGHRGAELRRAGRCTHGRRPDPVADPDADGHTHREPDRRFAESH